MNRERVNELWVRFLSGEDMTLSEEQEVVDALREDPELRKRLLRDAQLDGTLLALGWSASEEELFTREFSDGLAAERDGTSFVHRVELRVKGDGSQPAEPQPARDEGRGAGDATKSTRRFLRHRHTRPVRSPWGLFGIAAAALFGVALLAVFLSSGGGRRGKEGNPERIATEKSAEARRKRTEEERVRAEEARKRAEARLKEIEREQAKIARPGGPPAADPQADEKRKAALARLVQEKEEVEQEMREAIERARKAREEFAKTPEKAKEPVPKGESLPPLAPRQASETKVVQATVERVEGEVYILSEGQRIPAKAQDGILAGQGLEAVGPKSRAVVIYPDRTRLEAGPGTLIQSVSERTEKEGVGKWLDLRKGTLAADVAKQPAGRAMAIGTPHAEVRVLGTTLRLIVDPDSKGATELEVREGRVKLARLLDGKTVDVMSGHYAVAAVGIELIAKPGVAPSTLREGLLGHWRFDEASGPTAVDSSGHGHDGKIVGATRTPSKLRSGLKFDGLRAHIACGPGPSFKGTGAFTVCAWIRTASPADQVLFLQTATTVAGGQYSVGVVGGKVQWYTVGGNGGFKLFSDRVVNDARWHHVLAQRDKDGTGQIFIDGKPGGTSSAVPLADMSGGNIYIGAEQCCTKWYFNGILDDVRLYERALSPEEIATLAAAPE